MHRLATVIVICVLTLNAAAQTDRRPSHSEPDKEQTAWIAGALRSIETIKVGMSRSDLTELFTTEGGVYSPSRRTYVYRECPYIKVDVKFAAVPGVELPNDKIVEISRPYLAWFVAD